MESPYLPRSVFGDDFEHVYEPAEDTFLLLDALENDLASLKKHAFVSMECGSGSGSVITALSKSLSENSSNRIMFATDINMRACKTSMKCARYHGQNHLQVIRTNLAEALVDRLKNCVDLLVFNPPYVPTTQSEIESGSEEPIYFSWAGGQNGRASTDRFVQEYIPQLISKPNGTAYLVALDQNNIDYLRTVLIKQNISGSVVMQRRAGIEYLSVIKYVWLTT